MAFGRFQQITTAISLRKENASRQENLRISWQTRMLSQYIAAGYQMGKDQENTALKDAYKISYDDIERKLLDSPNMSQAPKENSAGSYEKLMGMFAR